MHSISAKTKKLLTYVFGTALAVATVAAVLVVAGCKQKQMPLNTQYISPSAIAATSDGGVVVADAGMNCLYKLNADGSVAKTAEVGAAANGVCVSSDGTVYATVGGLNGKVVVLDSNLNKKAEIEVGHTPVSPVLSPDQSKLYVANRFTGNVSVINTATNKVDDTICDMREPIALAVTSDGTLYVGAHLPAQAMTETNIASVILAVSPDGNITEIEMTNGTTSLKDMCVSPDGKYIVATHIIARYGYPTTQLDRGWINTNAISLISTESKTCYHSVLLDGVDNGAANPYGVTFSPDNEYIAVAIAGTNQVEMIHYNYLLTLLSGVKKTDTPPEDDLTFLDDIRYRIDLPGIGPRAITVSGNYLFAAQYFTGNVVKFTVNRSELYELSLGTQPENNVLRTGEIVWNDGTLCYQGWQTCASCHPDGRADGVNWDNLNDGVGNSKSTKSLLYSYRTPPEMITGIRANAEIATRAGMKYIEFSTVDEELLVALDEYIKSFEPEASPYLNKDGSLSEAAKRGKTLFESAEVGCATCHPAPYFTDLKMYDVGTVNPATDGASQVVSTLDTPTLLEIWRTAPYLYNGKAATIYDVIKTFNENDTHGKTSHLTEEQLRDLEAYVLSIGAEGEDFGVTTVISEDKDGNQSLMTITPGTTIRSVEVRKLTSGAESATVTFELFDKDGKSLAKKSKKTAKLDKNYTESIKLDIKVPENLEKGAYYVVTIHSGNNKATDFKIYC